MSHKYKMEAGKHELSNPTLNCVLKLSTTYVALTLPISLPLLHLPSPEVMNLNWLNLFAETIGCWIFIQIEL